MIMTAVRKANRDALRRPDQCTARLQESADRLGIGDRGAKVDTAIRFRLRDVKVVIQGSTDDLAGVRNRAQQLYVGKRINRRSEEHTSELQSLMRTSYAVFCLKKKTTTDTTNIIKTLTQ